MEENFVCRLESNARRFGDKDALVWESGALSWSELDRRASGFARHLADRGIRSGDRVAILMPNQWRFVVAFMATLKLGATPAPLNPSLKKEEHQAILADLRPKQVIEDVKVWEGEWVTRRRTASPALILYTSGSTGKPKGAVFSHKSLIFANRSWGGPILDLKSKDVVLAALPLAHSFGLYVALMAPLLSGAAVALLERFTPEAVFSAVKKLHVTVFPGVATMFHRLLSSPLFPGADLSSLRFAVSGAAPCSWELCADWQDKTGRRILCGYGSTEVPRPISYFSDDESEVPGATGRLVPGVKIRVMTEEGKPAGCGGVGELWIKSPAAMNGYLDDPDETRAVLTKGWFKTGDLGTVLPGGFVRIVGRKRERILRGGFSVLPQEVEAALYSHPAIAEAAVIGVPDPDVGEEIAAFVTFKGAARTTAEDLIAHCTERLAHYKYPRQIIILDELPKGSTGKILKSELLKQSLPPPAGK